MVDVSEMPGSKYRVCMQCGCLQEERQLLVPTLLYKCGKCGKIHANQSEATDCCVA